MKKTAIIAALAAALGAGTAWAHEGMHGDPTPGKTATLTGELVDLACYLGHGAKGEKHQKCAKMCVNGGAPLGILMKDGDLYLVVADHADEKPYGAAKAMAGEDAKLTGKIVKSGGLPAIVVSKAEKP